jgi:AcrR family transcriptional regulator
VCAGDSRRHRLGSGSKRAEERARIVAGIARALSERGYAGLDSEQLLRYCGVSRERFEAHFESCEQGLIAAQEAFLDRLWLEVEGACDASREWAVNVRAAVAAALLFLAEAAALARVFAVEATAVSLAANARQFARLESFADLLSDGRNVHPRAAAMPPTTERALIGGIASIVADRLLSEEAQDLVRLEPQLSEFVLLPFLGPAEARRVVRLPRGQDG